MYIEKLHIDSFGKLADIDIELGPAVNIIEGANESGKSTVAAFIKFILYGVPSRERARLLSWQTGGAAGSITLNDGGKSYRIERAVVGTREAVQLIDVDTNTPMRHALDKTTPGEFFLGVDADMFASTAFVSQLGGTVSGGAKVSEGIENILFSADENVNTQRAGAKLDSARAALLHKNEKGGRLYEMDGECAAVEVRLAEALRAHDEILSKESQLADMKLKLEAAETKARDIGSRVEQYETGVLLGTFEKRRQLEARVEELRTKIEDGKQTDVGLASELESQMNRLDLLSREVEETSAKAGCDVPETANPKLDEYIARGGREAVKGECDLCRTRAKTYTAVGVVALVLGLLLVAFGALPMMMGGSPQFGFVIGGAALGALALTLFILGSRSRGRADSIEAEYDFDALDAALAKRESAFESARLAVAAAEAASRRYDEECEAVRRKYGCEVNELSSKFAEQKQKLRALDTLKAEYDKYATLLSQVCEQLKPYSEEELREKLDDKVDTLEINAESLPEMRREAEFSAKMAASLSGHCATLEKELAGMYPTCENPTELADKLTALKTERESLRKKHAAYKLAAEKLIEASENLRESVAPRLASDAAGLMAQITGGKYRELGVGADLEMSAQTESGLKPLDLLSAGTQDAAYLCLRMALISLLYRKSLPPMVYDEAFARQDDNRLENLLKLVSLQEMQSIIFTSNDRESTIMRRIGEHKLIQL
ncbi:MAG: AAA family ATPase [Clostridia bacterium]|nr:AAA family ATPase [Clostridia bacterium]